jgi:8-oxo-dGTP diphosphatase
MHSWVVGGAVIEGPDGLLLVQNRRRGGRFDWSPPGGVIEVEDGEALIDGLAREVLEETGLVVTRWEGPIYEIATEAPGLGWTLRVEAYRAVEFAGELVLEDPDGIVVDARYVATHECGEHLEGNHPWVVEPLLEWLEERWVECRAYGYHVAGDDMRDLVITRVS